jgi:SAM-dependent methyltransferase
MSTDRWAGGPAYESYIGRWSRRVAPELVAWLNLPARGAWLDVGCGTGSLSATILDRAAPASVVGVDPSADFIEHARATILDARARFETGSADSLPLETGSADAAVAGLVLNFVPDIPAALAEMRRVVRAGGWLAAYVWDYGGGMEVLRRYWEAAAAVDPVGVEAVGAELFPICEPGALAAAFRGAGLEDVEDWAIEIPAVFVDFDDYWRPFLSGIGPAPGFNLRLDEARRAAVRERLRATLPVEPDGSIHLTARAWAARGAA